jgi:hypothetical protein
MSVWGDYRIKQMDGQTFFVIVTLANNQANK